jgi:hypothetical protein
MRHVLGSWKICKKNRTGEKCRQPECHKSSNIVRYTTTSQVIPSAVIPVPPSIINTLYAFGFTSARKDTYISPHGENCKAKKSAFCGKRTGLKGY